MPYAPTSNIGIGLNLGSYVVSRITDNYVAILNGVDQYWQLSEAVTIPTGADFLVEFDCKSLGGGYILANSQSTDSVLGRFVAIGSDTYGYISNSGLASINQSKFTIERVAGVIASNSTAATEVNEAEISIDRLLGKFAGTTSIPLSSGSPFNFRIYIDGVIVCEIPLTNKSQGATQLPTIGSVSATLVNYNESVWTKE